MSSMNSAKICRSFTDRSNWGLNEGIESNFFLSIRIRLCTAFNWEFQRVELAVEGRGSPCRKSVATVDMWIWDTTLFTFFSKSESDLHLFKACLITSCNECAKQRSCSGRSSSKVDSVIPSSSELSALHSSSTASPLAGSSWSNAFIMFAALSLMMKFIFPAISNFATSWSKFDEIFTAVCLPENLVQASRKATMLKSSSMRWPVTPK